MSGKSKLGCSTCRQRKVKCDETLPVCYRCKIARRVCDGPSRHKFVLVNQSRGRGGRPDAVTTSHDAPMLHGSQSIWAFDAIPGLSSGEAYAFDYFRQVVAPSLAEDLDKDFWAVTLPQISHGNAEVRYAVLTISALYQDPFPCSWTQEKTTARDAKYKRALAWYTRSLSGFSSSLRNGSRGGAPPTAEELRLNLLSCLLFTTIEFQQNNVLNACKLLYHGFSMVKDAACLGLDLENMMSGAVMDVMTQMLDRQRLIMTLFGHMPPPTVNGRLSTVRSSSQQHKHAVWKTLNEARIDLYNPLYRTSQLIRVARTTKSQGSISATTTLLAEQGSILEKFHQWHQSFEAFQASRGSKEMKQDLRGATSLQLFHQTAHLWAETCLLSEFDNDNFLHRFQKIIDLSKQLLEQRQEHEHDDRPATFSFEMGTVAPVYLLGWKCRDPGLRREALDLLRRSRGQEALYSASLHARALEKIIEIEEAANADSWSREEANNDDGLEVVAEQKKQRLLARYRVRNVTIHYERPDGAKVQPVLIYDMQCANGRLTEERMLWL